MVPLLDRLTLAQRDNLEYRLKQIEKEYIIGGPIGKTGHNIVYLVLDKGLLNQVTLKIPLLLSESDPMDHQLAQERTEKQWVSSLDLTTEAAALGILRGHDHIPQIYCFSTHPDPFLAIKYIKGKTIKRYIQDVHEHRHHPLKPSERLRIIAQVADALGHAHSQGLIHADVKPANILIEDYTNNGILIDYDIVRFPKDHPFSKRQDNTTIQGTPKYVAPELLEGRWDLVDHRIDIYALGAVCYEFIIHIDTPSSSYRLPLHQVQDMVEKRKNHPPPSGVYPKLILPEWDDPILKAMEEDPDKRYQSAFEFRDVLYRLVEESELKEKKEGITERQIWEELLSPDIDQIVKSG